MAAVSQHQKPTVCVRCGEEPSSIKNVSAHANRYMHVERGATRSLACSQRERDKHTRERECNIAVDMLKAWVRTAASTQHTHTHIGKEGGWMGALGSPLLPSSMCVLCQFGAEHHPPMCIHGVVGAVVPKVNPSCRATPCASRSSQSPGDAAGGRAGDGAQAPAGWLALQPPPAAPLRRPRSRTMHLTPTSWHTHLPLFTKFKMCTVTLQSVHNLNI